MRPLQKMNTMIWRYTRGYGCQNAWTLASTGETSNDEPGSIRETQGAVRTEEDAHPMERSAVHSEVLAQSQASKHVLRLFRCLA